MKTGESQGIVLKNRSFGICLRYVMSKFCIQEPVHILPKNLMIVAVAITIVSAKIYAKKSEKKKGVTKQ